MSLLICSNCSMIYRCFLDNHLGRCYISEAISWMQVIKDVLPVSTRFHSLQALISSCPYPSLVGLQLLWSLSLMHPAFLDFVDPMCQWLTLKTLKPYQLVLVTGFTVANMSQRWGCKSLASVQTRMWSRMQCGSDSSRRFFQILSYCLTIC